MTKLCISSFSIYVPITISMCENPQQQRYLLFSYQLCFAFVCSQKHERCQKIINDCFTVFGSHLLWRRRRNSPLCFSGISRISRWDCIFTVCFLCCVACLYWYFLKGSIDWKVKSSVVAQLLCYCRLPDSLPLSISSWLAPPPSGGAGPPAALPALPPPVRHKTLPLASEAGFLQTQGQRVWSFWTCERERLIILWLKQ